MRGAKPAGVAALGASAVLLLVIAADDYASHGWSARFFATDSRGRFLVHAATEHRTSFPNALRPTARYVQHWDYARRGLPASLPPLDVELRAALLVPEGAPRALRVKTVNAVRLSVDGREAEEPELAPGRHDVALAWTGESGARAQLRLRWRSPGGDWEEVPRRAFTPAEAGAGPFPSLLWAVGLLSMALCGWLLTRAMKAEGAARERLLGVLAALWIFALAACVRLYDYDVMPDFRENLDELSAAWNGWQLLTDGSTRGWSLWHTLYGPEVARERVAYFDASRLHVIVPFYDHPPLFHLLVGAAAKLGGATHWSHARLSDTRLVPLALSLATLGLLLALGRRLDPAGPSPYFAGLLFAIIPTIALQSRAVKEDALLVPLVLAALLFFSRYRDQGERRRDLVAAAVLVGLGVLAKLVGVVFIFVLALLVWQHGKRRDAMLVVLVSGLVSSLLLLYAAFGDWQAFWEAQRVQGVARGARYFPFARFFTASLVNQNWIGQGFLVFLWSAYFMSFNRREQDSLLTFPVFLYLAAMGLAAGTWIHGWYAMPLYPFLCIGAGRFLADLWRRPSLLAGALLVLLLVFYPLEFSYDPEWADNPANFPALRAQVAISLILLGPFVLYEAIRTGTALRLARATVVLALVSFAAASIRMIARYDVIYDKVPSFDRVDYFTR